MHANALYAATLLALVSQISAIQVTSPSSSTVWSSGTSGQTVSWQSVSTDPTSFVIQLVNQAGFLSNSPVTLTANQSTGSSNVVNSATVTYPSGSWPVGTAFQINLMSSSNSNAAILAQSQQFNITSSGSTAASGSSSASSSASGPTTISASKTSVTSSATVVTITSASGNSSGDASGGIPNSASTSKSAGELLTPPSALVSLLLAFIGYLGVFA
ncbi:hypothetical protein EHS25_007584 [Saitozyma podzolica]|uniref:Yeast cell wall synthesis Kre9/Knh1-like N-terminal domain-containing protein n=1 Tax=Saitozyma podzolica TaxID=1890683 RepID=A0A427YQ96_9TREE|nr:hypothetical protein EHS25_007584 [Saitozyma podzolica]